MDPIRTGAARIALDAFAGGARDLAIVPIGLTVPDKAALRAEVCVRVGEPIPVHRYALGRPAEHSGSEDRDAVRTLTDDIDARLRMVATDFETVEEWWAMDAAAEIVARSMTDDPEPPLATRVDLSARLGRGDPSLRSQLAQRVGVYGLLLRRAHLSDAAVAGDLGAERVVRRAVIRAALLALFSPLLAIAVAVNAIPVALTAFAGAFIRVPVTKGTVRAFVAILTFPVAWWVAAAQVFDRIGPQLLLAAGYAAGGYVALLAAETSFDVARTILAMRATYERRAYLDALREHRDAVLASAREVLGATR